MYLVKFTMCSYSVGHLSKASREEVILTYVLNVSLRCCMHCRNIKSADHTFKCIFNGQFEIKEYANYITNQLNHKCL